MPLELVGSLLTGAFCDVKFPTGFLLLPCTSQRFFPASRARGTGCDQASRYDAIRTVHGLLATHFFSGANFCWGFFFGKNCDFFHKNLIRVNEFGIIQNPASTFSDHWMTDFQGGFSVMNKQQMYGCSLVIGQLIVHCLGPCFSSFACCCLLGPPSLSLWPWTNQQTSFKIVSACDLGIKPMNFKKYVWWHRDFRQPRSAVGLLSLPIGFLLLEAELFCTSNV